MSTDIEDLLRAGMERFTADLRAPAGLARRAARRRRRRLALPSVTAAVALAAGAAALVAVVVPGGRDAGMGSAVDVAYVVQRADSALSAAGPGTIAQMTVTTRATVAPGGVTTTTTAEEWSYGDQWRSVTYSQAGHPVYDEGFSSSSVFTLVSYLTRTWARQSGLGRPAGDPVPEYPAPAAGNSLVPVAGGCRPVSAALPFLLQPGLPGIGFSATSPPATVARALRTEISCGALTVAGRQRVDGIDAIELTSRSGSLATETIWVSPGTYLPVRIVIRSGPGRPALQRTADITWLRPTTQNLAQLTVPVPAGFRQVPVDRVVGPILYQVPGRARPQALCPLLASPPAGTRPLVPAPPRSGPVIRRLPSSPAARIPFLLGPGDVC